MLSRFPQVVFRSGEGGKVICHGAEIGLCSLTIPVATAWADHFLSHCSTSASISVLRLHQICICSSVQWTHNTNVGISPATEVCTFCIKGFKCYAQYTLYILVPLVGTPYLFYMSQYGIMMGWDQYWQCKLVSGAFLC